MEQLFIVAAWRIGLLITSVLLGLLGSLSPHSWLTILGVEQRERERSRRGGDRGSELFLNFWGGSGGGGENESSQVTLEISKLGLWWLNKRRSEGFETDWLLESSIRSERRGNKYSAWSDRIGFGDAFS